MTLNADIEKQHAALLRIVMGLFSLLGIQPGSSVFSIPRSVAEHIEYVLLSAESAMTWLMIAQARRNGMAFSASDAPLRAAPVRSPQDGPPDAERLCARLNALLDIFAQLSTACAAVGDGPRPVKIETLSFASD